MIKYMQIPGFSNVGEQGMMSHIYVWVRDAMEDKNRDVIIVKCYVTEKPEVWKGLLFNKTKTAHSRPNLEVDLTELEKLVGPLKVVTNLQEFFKGTDFENQMKDFKEVVEVEVK